MEQRRLAAIMFSDIVGYSRAMGRNETAALGMLREHNVVVEPVLAQFGGKIIKRMGDGLLVEFQSAVLAVQCAVAVQKRLAERNGPLPPGERVFLRIGIHLGDVVAMGADILGDGVNVASRIEPLAEPGGICISQDIYNQIQGKIEVETVSLGPRDLKNIERQIEIFRVLVGALGPGAAPPRKKTGLPLWIKIAAVAAVIVLAVLVLPRKTRQKSPDPRKAAQAPLPPPAEAVVATRAQEYMDLLLEEDDPKTWNHAVWPRVRKFIPPGEGGDAAAEAVRKKINSMRLLLKLSRTEVEGHKVEKVVIEPPGGQATAIHILRLKKTGAAEPITKPADTQWRKVGDEWYLLLPDRPVRK